MAKAQGGLDQKNVRNHLQLARDIVTDVRAKLGSDPLANTSLSVSILAIAEYLIGDATLSPTSIGPDHQLCIFLLLGGNIIDLRCHKGELYA